MMQQPSWSKVASGPKPPPQQMISTHTPPGALKPAVPQIPLGCMRTNKLSPAKTNGHSMGAKGPPTAEKQQRIESEDDTRKHVRGSGNSVAAVRRDSVHSTHSTDIPELSRTPQHSTSAYTQGYCVTAPRGFAAPSPAMPFSQPTPSTRSGARPSPLPQHAQPQIPLGSPMQTPAYIVPAYSGYPPIIDPAYSYYAAAPIAVSGQHYGQASPRPANAYAAPPAGPSFGPPAPMSRSASTLSDPQSHRHTPTTPKTSEFQLPAKKTSAIKIINPETKSEVVAKSASAEKQAPVKSEPEEDHPQKDLEHDRAKAEATKAAFLKQIQESKEREDREAREEAERQEGLARKRKQEEEDERKRAEEARIIEEKRQESQPTPLPQVILTSSEQDLALMPPPARKDKKIPSSLNLNLTKQISEPLPSAPLTALKTSKFINDITRVQYPEGVKSPNPALNMNAPSGRIVYDKDFLLQFQAAYTDKPMIDWDERIKETIGDLSGDSRPASTRSTGGRTASRIGGAPPMGSLGLANLGPAASSLTSQQRFELSTKQGVASQKSASSSSGSSFPIIGAHFKPSLAPLGSGRSASASGSSYSAGTGPGSPRTKSTRGAGSRRGGTSEGKTKEKSDMEKGLTIPIDQVKPLESSATRWKPRVQTESAADAGPALGNEVPLMAPDVVQRKVKALLNKITPNNEEKITAQVLEISAQSKRETDGQTLRQVIQLTFEKATDEPNFSSVYADSARRMMDQMDSDIKDEKVVGKSGQPLSGGLLFRKYLLNRCQEEFERGWNVPPKTEGISNSQEAAVLLSDEYYLAAAAKRRGLGLIKFIGELYKRGMLVEKIMHECVRKLLQNVTDPEEEEVESLCKLLTTVGGMLDKDKGVVRMSAYFDRLGQLLESEKIPSRMRFMVMDLIDLRRKGWQDKAAEAGPKTIAEIHADAAKAQQEAAVKSTTQSRRPEVSRSQNRNPNFAGVPPNSRDGWSTVKAPSRQALAGDLSRLGMMRTNSQGSSLGPGGAFTSSRSASGNGTKKPHPARLQDDDSPTTSRSATPGTRKPSQAAQSVNQFDLLTMDTGDSLTVSAETLEGEDSLEPQRERPKLNLLPKGSTLGETSRPATAADKY